MKRVLVIGSGGAGKSTFARHLGASLQLPVVHLDAHYWCPGWIEPDRQSWNAAVDQLLLAEQWVIDGNYSATLPARLAACDTVVFLDLPRWLCLWRVLGRALRYRGETRPDMAAGCPEQLNWAFLRWVWGFPTRSRPQVIELLERQAGGRRVIHLRSARAVGRFLQRLY